MVRYLIFQFFTSNIYKDVVLTDIYASPSSPQKYARKLMPHLFSNEEMSEGLFPKVGPSTRQQLSPSRRNFLNSNVDVDIHDSVEYAHCHFCTDCLLKMYTAKVLKKAETAIRESLNQKCREVHISKKAKNSSEAKNPLEKKCMHPVDDLCSSEDTDSN